MNRRHARYALLGTAMVATVLATASSCDQATQDRSSQGGQNPDSFGEARNVRVYTNADSVPNVAVFCIEDMTFVSTLSGGDTGANKAAQIMRLPEWDASYCGKKAG